MGAAKAGCEPNVAGNNGRMRINPPLAWLLAALGAALAAGCSSPEARNEADPGVFARLGPAEQELVRRGEAAVGFSRDAVRLALGDPDRAVPGSGDQEADQVWTFTAYKAGGTVLFTGMYHAYRRHGFGWDGNWGPAYPYFLDYPDRVATARIRVSFEGDRVIAISREPL